MHVVNKVNSQRQLIKDRICLSSLIELSEIMIESKDNINYRDVASMGYFGFRSEYAAPRGCRMTRQFSSVDR